MKIRSGFVSNSSSSSFIILKASLNDRQKEMLFDHIEFSKEIDKELVKKGDSTIYEYYEEWFIDSDDLCYWCHTSMDNFDLDTFLTREANVHQDDIIYMGDGWYDKPIWEEDFYQKFKIKIRNEKIDKIKKKNESRG